MDFELISASRRDAIVVAHLRASLSSLGLEEVTARTWVDGKQPPQRRVFQLQLLKGAGMKACWGFSLDFVPHISAGRMRWHRSDATAKLDVIVDLRGLLQPSYIHGLARLESDLHQLLPEAVSKAQECWKRGATYGGMLDIIREIRSLQTNCFAYYNYTQLPLAFAFLLAKTGDLLSARQELDAYVQVRRLDEIEAGKLCKLAEQYAASV